MGGTPELMLIHLSFTSRFAPGVSYLPRAFCSGFTKVEAFVQDKLSVARFDAPTIAEETAVLNSAGIVSLDVMKQLTDSDWRGIGLKVGSSRVLQNALQKGDAVPGAKKMSRQQSLKQMRLCLRHDWPIIQQ